MSSILAVLGYPLGKVGHKGASLGGLVSKNSGTSSQLLQRLSAVADHPRAHVYSSKSLPNEVSRTHAQK